MGKVNEEKFLNLMFFLKQKFGNGKKYAIPKEQVEKILNAEASEIIEFFREMKGIYHLIDIMHFEAKSKVFIFSFSPSYDVWQKDINSFLKLYRRRREVIWKS